MYWYVYAVKQGLFQLADGSKVCLVLLTLSSDYLVSFTGFEYCLLIG